MDELIEGKGILPFIGKLKTQFMFLGNMEEHIVKNSGTATLID